MTDFRLPTPDIPQPGMGDMRGWADRIAVYLRESVQLWNGAIQAVDDSIPAPADLNLYALRSLNLSDLASPAVARGNLGAISAMDLATALTVHPLKVNNLSDLANVATARGNLGLGNSATRNVGTASGTVAAGDDSRLTSIAVRSLSAQVLAATAVCTFAVDPSYRINRAELIRFEPVGTSENLCVRFSYDGGVTYKSGASDYQYSWVYWDGSMGDAAGTGATPGNSILLSMQLPQGGNPSYMTLELEPGRSGYYPTLKFQGFSRHTSGYRAFSGGATCFFSAAAVTHVALFYTNAKNIGAGASISVSGIV